MIAAVEHIRLVKDHITMTWHQKAKVNYMTKLTCGFLIYTGLCPLSTFTTALVL